MTGVLYKDWEEGLKLGLLRGLTVSFRRGFREDLWRKFVG